MWNEFVIKLTTQRTEWKLKEDLNLGVLASSSLTLPYISPWKSLKSMAGVKVKLDETEIWKSTAGLKFILKV